MRWVGPRSDKEGVTPVVGSILILVIMIMAIGGIMAFGVPIINGLQDYAEFQNVVTQFQELDADVRNLRDPQNVRVSTISTNKGELALSTGDRWVITVIKAGANPSFAVSDWEVADDVNNDGLLLPAIASTTYTIEEVKGSTFKEITPSCAGGAVACSIGDLRLDKDVVRVVAVTGGEKWAEAWIMNVGRLSFRQAITSELNQVHYEMGAVMTEQDDAFFIQQVPTVKEPDPTLNDNTLFIRMLRFRMTEPETVSGEGRHTIITNLVDNYGEARGRPAYEDVELVRIQVDGIMEEAFCNYFIDRSELGWAFPAGITSCETDADLDTTHVVFPRPASGLRFDMIHSEVHTDLR